MTTIFCPPFGISLTQLAPGAAPLLSLVTTKLVNRGIPTTMEIRQLLANVQQHPERNIDAHSLYLRAMRNIISTSEVIHPFSAGGEHYEVFAAADAHMDATNELSVELTACLRSTHFDKPLPDPHPKWLPTDKTVVEKVGRDEAIEVAKDVFQSWVRTIRASIPTDQELARFIAQSLTNREAIA